MTNVFVRFIVFSLKRFGVILFLVPVREGKVQTQAVDLSSSMDTPFNGIHASKVTSSLNSVTEPCGFQGVMKIGMCTKGCCIFDAVQSFWALFNKELRLELRQKHALAGVLLYVLATVFVCYLGFEQIESAKTWGALLWVTGVFTAFNAMQKTFVSETAGTHLYMYTLANPRAIILAKAIYNALLIAVLNLLSVFFFMVFFGTAAFADADMAQFIAGLLLGSTGLGFALTFVAGIAFRSGAGIGLVAILGFPVIIPLLITIVRQTTLALEGASVDANSLNVVVLIVLNVVSFALSYILFPYLWRE
jgi:heme exporter protein B